ncbi:hypothetical protein NFI96_001930 [Prochilodus magdalenae]|nr:hypothetical protein NFI96_001930 [Prochilodus magdalenae]
MNGLSSHVQKTWCPSTSTPTAPSAGTVEHPRLEKNSNKFISLYEKHHTELQQIINQLFRNTEAYLEGVIVKAQGGIVGFFSTIVFRVGRELRAADVLLGPRTTGHSTEEYARGTAADPRYRGTINKAEEQKELLEELKKAMEKFNTIAETVTSPLRNICNDVEEILQYQHDKDLASLTQEIEHTIKMEDLFHMAELYEPDDLRIFLEQARRAVDYTENMNSFLKALFFILDFIFIFEDYKTLRDFEKLQERSTVEESEMKSKAASSLALKARAKAEATRAELAFAKQEAEMLKQQAIIQANLHELRMEKAAAAAKAEAEILEAAAEEYERRSPPQQRKNLMLLQTSAKLHGENAAAQMSVQQPGHQSYQSVTAKTLNLFTASPPDAKPPMTSHSPVHQPTMDSSVQNCRNQGEMPSSEISDHEFVELGPRHSSRGQATWNLQQHTSTAQKKTCSFYEPPYNINQISSEYKPPHPYQAHSVPMYNTSPPSAAATTDLGKYLIRRELVSSGLLKFDDKPENYWAWKASFHSSTEDLMLSAREELDLLCKWLGPSSSEQARRIRAVHIHNPPSGLRMLWQRLEDVYGSPEVIENALLKKVEDFPKISVRDNHKLRELGDILMELEAAKVDGYLPGLSYLNTSRGVSPIVQKLPHTLQEKWITVGTRYKEQHRIPYPPFLISS